VKARWREEKNRVKITEALGKVTKILTIGHGKKISDEWSDK
jgi:hypothetical protein